MRYVDMPLFDNSHIIWNEPIESELKKWQENFQNVVIIFDDKLSEKYKQIFSHFLNFQISISENKKSWETCHDITTFLLKNNIDKYDLIVGIGGGVLTDLVGFVASIYKRGINFALVPTTILAMVDASIGGKNGINIGSYKNVIGVINQPWAIVYDYDLLNTLATEEWINGFAEIIKHACINSMEIWNKLNDHELNDFKNNYELLHKLIQLNVATKLSIVHQDPNEKGIRKILNFGHTIGHAIEIQNNMPHGSAIAIGMVFAAFVSEKLLQFNHSKNIVSLLKKYHLPTQVQIDIDTILPLLANDKKMKSETMQFILIKDIADPVIENIKLQLLQSYLHEFCSR